MTNQPEIVPYINLVHGDLSSLKRFPISPGGDLMTSVKVPRLSFFEAEALATKHRIFMFGRADWPEEWVLWMIHTHYFHIDIWQTLPNSILSQQLGVGVWPDASVPLVFLTQRSSRGLPVGLVAKPHGQRVQIEINHFGPPSVLN